MCVDELASAARACISDRAPPTQVHPITKSARTSPACANPRPVQPRGVPRGKSRGALDTVEHARRSARFVDEYAQKRAC